MNTLFSIQNMNISYKNEMLKDKEILQNVNLSFYEGQISFIHGQNGSGKTSLLKALVGLMDLNQAFIKIPNQEKLLSFGELNKTYKIGYIPQYPKDFQIPSMSIVENIIFRSKIFEAKGLKWSSWLQGGLTKTEVNKVHHYTEELSFCRFLKNRLYDNYKHFSGGQLQLINLVSILYADVDILIMDEPTAKLDDENKSAFWELLSEILEKYNITVVCTTHEKSYKYSSILGHSFRELDIVNGSVISRP